MATDNDVAQSDLRELLLLLGMGDHARPQSPHEVFQEALRVLRKRVPPYPFPGRRGEKAQAIAEAAANRWDAFHDRDGVYWLKDAILDFKTEDDTRTISWANHAVEQLQEALSDAERERDEWKALAEKGLPPWLVEFIRDEAHSAKWVGLPGGDRRARALQAEAWIAALPSVLHGGEDTR